MIKNILFVFALWPVWFGVYLIFLPSGDRFSKSQGKIPSREPYEVIDTLSLSSGFGSVVLNKHFTKEKHNVKPTHKMRMFPFVTQIIDDTSATVRYYAVYISANLETLMVKSSSAIDTSNVRIRILMK